MLARLERKHAGKQLRLLAADFFEVDFGVEKYDAVISFQAMHHFTYEEKKVLYARIWTALRPGRKYLECDYMVLEETEAEGFYRESVRIREKYHLSEAERYHLDIPLTVPTQLELLSKSGFSCTAMVWRRGNTTLLVACK